MKQEDLKKGLEIDEKVRDVDKNIKEAEAIKDEIAGKGNCSFTIAQSSLKQYGLNLPEEIVTKLMDDYIKSLKADKTKLEKEFNDI